MSHPILKQVQAVFIHVKDLPRAVEWYHQLFRLPRPESSVEGPVHVIEMENGVHFLLDDNRNTPTDTPLPSAMLSTPDIDEAHRFLREQGAEIVREIERYSDVSFFNFRDPDGNILMVCQQHR
ncbi:putative enzyme related to lactoylglutathione lyase [Melghirimyces profundicolus]|uniref:Putative enzyme related to lactoylglutathione lyase n=1 Tax=Melghirimyces profundicolus TaxID=1242148 RepID=A0A2T6BGY4_9BACL|nr:VOC family protein [Melghirimyces profundicolus]PTX55312.1 putative enzyme related to lactoylglutathione lyase [Melghirimyces profundicolus]